MKDHPETTTVADALRVSEEWFHTLFNSMLEGFVYCRMLFDDEGEPADWIHLSVNPAFEQITGLKDIAGKKVTEAIPGVRESLPELFEVLGRVVRTGTPEQFEINFIPLSKWLNISVYRPQKDHFVAVFEDITKRKHAEEVLKRSLARFKTVMDSLDALVYVVDMQTYEILFVNKYGRDIWGDIEGKVCWATIQSGQTGPCPFCTNDRLVDAAGKPIGTYAWEFKNTVNERWYDCRDSAIQWPDGRIVRMEIATDITERKEIEDALHESEEKFRDLFENSRDGIVIADTVTRKFVDSNRTFSRLLGYAPEEIKNLGVPDIHPEDRLLYVFETFEKMVRHEITVAGNLPVLRKDGTIFYADISTYPIHISNKIYLVGVFRDITERKKAEEALQASEHRSAKMLEALPDMMFVVSREGIYHDFSVADPSDLAVPRDKIIGTNVRDSGFGEATTETILHHVTLALETKILQRFEYELALPGGTRQYEARMVALTDDEALGIVRDITDRKHAEEEINESEEKFRMIFEQSNDAILFAEVPEPGQLGNIIDVNKVALGKLGYAKEELVPGPIARIVSPRLKQELPAVLSELVASGHITFENELARKDGSLIPMEISAQTITIRDRSFIVGIARDITERKRVEEALQASERRSAKLLEAMPDMMFVIARDGTYRDFSVANPSELAVPPEKIIGTNVRDSRFAEATTETILHHVTLALETKTLQMFEYELAFPGGTRQYEARMVALTDDEALGIVRDITDRRVVEAALHQANKKLNMLSSITRHDILNLIMAIRGYLELALEDEGDPEIRRFMEKENEALNAIQRQIEFTRYYQDIGVEEPKWQDVGEIVTRVADQLDLEGITLECPLSGLLIFADPLIEKVFYNLIENSLRHGEHVTAIGFSSAETDSGLVISYRDNGVGIADEDKKKLFQRGFGKHSGLGLFLSREILSITGMTLRETGEPGKGVCFEILVPKGRYRFIR
jgi:PAS domain S-box-containing protein